MRDWGGEKGNGRGEERERERGGRESNQYIIYVQFLINVNITGYNQYLQ